MCLNVRHASAIPCWNLICLNSHLSLSFCPNLNPTLRALRWLYQNSQLSPMIFHRVFLLQQRKTIAAKTLQNQAQGNQSGQQKIHFDICIYLSPALMQCTRGGNFAAKLVREGRLCHRSTLMRATRMTPTSAFAVAKSKVRVKHVRQIPFSLRNLFDSKSRCVKLRLCFS